MFLHHSSNCAYITGHLLTFLPNNVIFPQNAPAYRAIFWLCTPIIQYIFIAKIPKKIIFTLISTIIQDTLLTFLPKNDYFLKMLLHIEHFLTFLPNNTVCFYTKSLKKLIFPQIATIIQGTLLTFLPKKVNLFSKCACICSKNPIKSGIFWICFHFFGSKTQ